MNNKKHHITWSVLLPLMIILWIPKEGIDRVVSYLEFRGLGIEQLELLMRVMPRETLCALILLASVLVLIADVIRMIRKAMNPQVPGLNRPRTEKEQKMHSVNRDGSRKAGSETVSADYAQRTGNARYMTQLVSYLESGLITKEEYLVLKKRYQK